MTKDELFSLQISMMYYINEINSLSNYKAPRGTRYATRIKKGKAQLVLVIPPETKRAKVKEIEKSDYVLPSDYLDILKQKYSELIRQKNELLQ